MNLRQAAFAGSRWTATSLLLRALLQIAQTMVIARLVSPSDFGLIAVAGAVYAIVALFVDLGLSNALIHFPRPSPATMSTLYWLNLCSALVMMAVFMALGWLLAGLYDQPALLPLMATMSLAMPLAALGQQFCIMAEKELKFGRVAVVELAATACGFAVAVSVAWQGGGAYALVANSVVAAATSSALAWLLLSAGLRPALRFDVAGLKPYLRYGSYRLGDALLNNFHSQADVLIGGAAVGAAAMGFYTVPRNLSLQVATSVINPVITRVGLPVMAKLQGDLPALRSVYVQSLRMTASLNFPIYAVLAVWSHEIVALVLGEQWSAAGDFMRLFALWGLVRSTGNPVGSLLYATGRVHAAFSWNMALLMVIPGLLWLGATQGGPRGLAVTMCGVQLLIFYPVYRVLVYPACGLRFGEYLGAFGPALLSSAVAVGLGFLVCSLVPESAVARVITGCAVTLLAYLGTSWILNRAWTDAMVEFLGPILRPGR